jgi:phosphatidate cytidylyltransferase
LTPNSRRLVVAAFGIPLVLVCVYAGGWIFAGFVGLAGALGAYEGYKLLAPQSPYAPLVPLILLSLTLPALAILEWPISLQASLVAAALLTGVMVLAQSPQTGGPAAVAVLALSVYPLLLLQHLLWLRLEFGWTQVLFLLALVWAGDTAAFEGGKRMGKRPLAQKLSPKKTVEGALFALAASLVVGVGAWQLGAGVQSGLWYLLAAVVVWALATAGDLFESLFKRQAGVKDSSRILSEHGGVLDRFDSLLFASVGLYYLHYLPL